MPWPTVVLFQVGALRLADNPMLNWAAERGPVLPLFAWAPADDGAWPLGAASRWWLHHSLRSLAADLECLGSRLVIRTGNSTAQIVAEVAAESGAREVALSAPMTEQERLRDASLREALLGSAVRPRRFNTRLLVPSEDVAPDRASPLRVYAAFWRACQPLIGSDAPLAAPMQLIAPQRWPRSQRLDELHLLPKVDWAAGIRAAWSPGEACAHRALQRFLEVDLAHYAAERDRLAADRTSRLSPYLHFGELSARQLWHALGLAPASPSTAKLRAELGWREFAHYLLLHHPRLPDGSLDRRFDQIEWRHSPSDLRCWQRGQTGFPLVDAGMRQLWQTGWMHNRVRMVVASFLVKDLLLPWQLGAKWFWDTLVDADIANNTVGWQWSAGAAADAAPFTRVFNPVLQAERFDPEGAYIRRYVPELARLPAPHVFQPWTAPADVLHAAGVRLGGTYPEPMIDHAMARKRALAAFAARKT